MSEVVNTSTGTTGGILSDQIKMYEAALTSQSMELTKANIKALFPASSGSQVQLKQLQAIPSLGGSTNNIDVTCLEDTAHRYIKGLKDYGDSIDFTFLYDNTPSTGNYAVLDALDKDTIYAFQIKFKDGESFYFAGKPSVAIDDIGVDSAITFTFSVALQSEIFYSGLSEN